MFLPLSPTLGSLASLSLGRRSFPTIPSPLSTTRACRFLELSSDHPSAANTTPIALPPTILAIPAAPVRPRASPASVARAAIKSPIDSARRTCRSVYYGGCSLLPSRQLPPPPRCAPSLLRFQASRSRCFTDANDKLRRSISHLHRPLRFSSIP